VLSYKHAMLCWESMLRCELAVLQTCDAVLCCAVLYCSTVPCQKLANQLHLMCAAVLVSYAYAMRGQAILGIKKDKCCAGTVLCASASIPQQR